MAEKTSNEALIMRIKCGERQLLTQLLEQNRGIMYQAARRYLPAARRNRALDMEDLMQAAALGMIEAVPAWDESRGAFTTLAALYMKKSIRAALGIHTTRQRVENTPCTSLDAPVEDGEETALIDTLADDTATDPAEAAALADMRHTVRAVAEALPEREYTAIRHILDGGPTVRDERGKINAMASLRRNIKLIRLWEEYGAAPYRHRGFHTWTYTHTSATEAAVLARERVLDGIKRHLALVET